MGILLLLTLSCAFGFIFTQHARVKQNEALSQVTELKQQLERLQEKHAFEKNVWRNTVNELLQEVRNGL